MDEILLKLKRGDSEYMAQTRRAMQPYLDQFAAQLSHIYAIMPVKILVTKDGVEDIIEPEWQELIDKIVKLQHDSLRQSFPEYFHK